MHEILFYGLVWRVAWLQGGGDEEWSSVEGRWRRLVPRHEMLHPLMAGMSQRGGGKCLDGGRTSQSNGGGRRPVWEVGVTQSEPVIKDAGEQHMTAGQTKWCYKNILVQFQTFDRLLFWLKCLTGIFKYPSRRKLKEEQRLVCCLFCVYFQLILHDGFIVILEWVRSFLGLFECFKRIYFFHFYRSQEQSTIGNK